VVGRDFQPAICGQGSQGLDLWREGRRERGWVLFWDSLTDWGNLEGSSRLVDHWSREVDRTLGGGGRRRMDWSGVGIGGDKAPLEGQGGRRRGDGGRREGIMGGSGGHQGGLQEHHPNQDRV